VKLAHVPIHFKRELFFLDISMKPLDLQRVKKSIRSREDRPLSSTIPEQRRPSCLFSGFDLSGYRTHGRLDKASSETERLHLRWKVHIDPECLKETKRLLSMRLSAVKTVFIWLNPRVHEWRGKDEANPVFEGVVPASKSSLFGHIKNPSMTALLRSRWLNYIDLVLFKRFDLDFISVHKNEDTTLVNI